MSPKNIMYTLHLHAPGIVRTRAWGSWVYTLHVSSNESEVLMANLCSHSQGPGLNYRLWKH